LGDQTVPSWHQEILQLLIRHSWVYYYTLKEIIILKEILT